MSDDPAASALSKNVAPPAFQSAPPTPAESERSRQAQLTPDQRATDSRARTDQQHNDAAARQGLPKPGEAWRDPSRAADPTAQPGADRPADGAARAAGEATKIKLTETLSVTEDEFRDVLARMGVEQSGRATAPTTAEAYELKLPENFTPVPGADGKPLEVKFDANDPMMKDGRAWALRHNLSQAAFSEALALVANEKLVGAQKFQQAFNAEKEKLGVNGQARVDAIATWYKGMLGDEGAKSLLNTLWTADAVRHVERLMSRFASQGAGGFSQANREPGDASGKLSAEQYNRMSTGERLEYARSASAGKR